MRMMSLSPFLLALAVTIIAYGTPASAKSKTTVVRVPDYQNPSSYPPYIADELGFFKQEGITVKFTGIIPPGQQVAAVVAGTNDVGTLHVNRTINGKAAGAKVKAVVAWSETAKDRPHMVYLALNGLKFDKPADLIGKKIGLVAFGGCNEYTPYEYLKNHGVSNPKGKFQIVQIPFGKEEQVLRQGEVDVVGYHAWPGAILKRGGVKILFSDYDVWGTIGGATPFYFSEKFIADNPETVRGFVKAIARANDWINANYNKADQLTAKRFKIDPTEVSTFHNAPKGIITEESVTVWLKILQDYNEIKPGQFKPSDIYTNEFNPFVKATAKKKR